MFIVYLQLIGQLTG